MRKLLNFLYEFDHWIGRTPTTVNMTICEP